MKVRTNIKEVFDTLRVNGFDIELGESCCSGPQSYPSQSTKCGWIRACVENDDIIMVDINEEGSAEVSWNFGPQDKISVIADSIVNAFTKKGYIVVWNKKMGGKITAVIEIDDLPTSFLKKWIGNIIEEDDDDDFIEERIDPDLDVIFDKDEDERSIFSTDEDEDEEEEEEDDAKSEPVIDPSSEEEEEDEDTVCPEDCNCINCEAERDD